MQLLDLFNNSTLEKLTGALLEFSYEDWNLKPVLHIPKWDIIVKGDLQITEFINMFDVYSGKDFKTIVGNIAHEIIMLHRALDRPEPEHVCDHELRLLFNFTTLPARNNIKLIIKAGIQPMLHCESWGFNIAGRGRIIEFIQLFDKYYSLIGGMLEVILTGCKTIVELQVDKRKAIAEILSSVGKGHTVVMSTPTESEGEPETLCEPRSDSVIVAGDDESKVGTIVHSNDLVKELALARKSSRGYATINRKLNESLVKCQVELANAEKGKQSYSDDYERMRGDLVNRDNHINELRSELAETHNALEISRKSALERGNTKWCSAHTRDEYITSRDRKIDFIKAQLAATQLSSKINNDNFERAHRNNIELSESLKSTQTTRDHYQQKYYTLVEKINESEIRLKGE